MSRLTTLRALRRTIALFLTAAGVLSFAPACTTEGFCFANCADGDGTGGSGGGSPSQLDSGILVPGDGSCSGLGCATGGSGSGGSPQVDCTPTNAGVEICDDADNDCDGKVDEPRTDTDDNGIDFTKPVNCGTCDVNCTDGRVLKSVETPVCSPPKSGLGTAAGTCDYDQCAPDHYDVDGDRSNGCEYACPWNPGGKNTKDLGGAFGCNRDDDCNGKVDDGLDLCKDAENCGSCGFRCSLPNTVTADCVTTATDGNCNANNTGCVVKVCEAGFVDANGSPDDGCEYPCTITNGGVEICDGKDNDCDKLFDNADPDLNDPALGRQCFGGDKGLCASVDHAGVTKCIDGVASCCDVGSNNLNAENPRYPDKDLRNNVCEAKDPPFVLVPGELQELCNGEDDDCDGQADGVTVDSNAVCGSNVGVCRTGLSACVGGVLTCVGGTQKDPAGEKCDGLDNDCDGVIDYTAPPAKIACTTDTDCASHTPYLACVQLSSTTSDKGCVALPTDTVNAQTGAPLACDETPPAPSGATQPCRPGTRACFGGVPVCQGSVKKPLDVDRCFEDTNCDGVLSNQTGLTNSDPKNCGACGNDCNAGKPNTAFQCQAGKCVPNGCKAGFIECGGTPNDCETACVFDQSTELCDGIDNDCDCQVDEAVVPPSPIQACGVSAAATDPGCTGAVSITCTGGVFKCTFTDPAYCTTGTCSTTPDACDGKDNNCNGVADEGFRPPALLVGFLGQACFSDDGKPSPGDGPCRTQGTFACSLDGKSTVCSATKDTSKATTELCDGVDNNCNGVVDDPAAIAANDSRLGKQCFGGTQGVCALPANAGTTSCVSGGVVCAGSKLVRPGDRLETCNGLDDDCSGTVDDNLTDTGGFCGSSVGQCRTGTQQCVTGALRCTGNTGPTAEVCDGLDNDCNGQIDDAPTDVGTACSVPPTAPPGVPQPCRAGTNVCIGGSRLCQGAVLAAAAKDNCNEDTNCDGRLTDQSGLTNNDVLNCGACGRDCNAIDANSNWACQNGTCVKTSCKAGFIDCDANANNCERACTATASTETCNGVDDNCNCQVDENLPAVTSVQVCGVSPAATDPGCTSNVVAVCTNGGYRCTFPAGYCTGGNCATTVELCDGKDNDCDGQTDENFKAPALTNGFLGQSCATPASDGPCQGTGSYVCTSNGAGTQCSAVKDNSKSSAEICDGIDNNCNGTVDETAAVSANDTRVGKQCFGGTLGECAAQSRAGTTACQSGAVVCTGANVLKPDALAETCNGKDDDCDGTPDDSPTDVGGTCGSGVGACSPGTYVCTAGTRVCQGGTSATTEKCNGIDDDCNGVIDNNPTDVGGDCNVPAATPAPTAQCSTVTSACQKGTLVCSGGVPICQGSITASASTPDGCCVDSNCDGVLTSQPNFLTDVNNCGGCGIDCNSLNAGKHGVWACQAGACVRTGCASGFINCDGVANDCERACPFSGTELCNGVDDNCDCTVDNLDTNVTPLPTPSQVCGVSALASDPKCLAGDGVTGVRVQCSAGAWQCTFPPNYCDQGSPKSCSTTPDVCDNRDNNCNGNTDDNYKPPVLSTGYVGQPCASDDGQAPPGDGACRTTGTFQCATTSTTSCNAVRDNTKAGAELCDGVDNDCDGSVDEPFSAKGTNTTHYVKPAVVQVSANLWVYQYEASRPTATTTSPGSGNGYFCTGAACTGGVPAAPSGATLDKTVACSVSSKIPWFNVTPIEVEQTCQARGGFICPTTSWTTACQAGSSCLWGYGTGCTTNANYPPPDTNTPYCNLGGYDFDRNAATPNTDGLLPTGSSLLSACYAKWGAGAGGSTSLLDLTGNLREITKRAANDYPLMGGAFSSQSDDGAQCSFNFYTVNTSFKFFDTGFRCCFSSNPG